MIASILRAKQSISFPHTLCLSQIPYKFTPLKDTQHMHTCLCTPGIKESQNVRKERWTRKSSPNEIEKKKTATKTTLKLTIPQWRKQILLNVNNSCRCDIRQQYKHHLSLPICHFDPCVTLNSWYIHSMDGGTETGQQIHCKFKESGIRIYVCIA